jgi:hypothetical protein
MGWLPPSHDDQRGHRAALHARGDEPGPVWCAGLAGRRLTAAVEELTDTLMVLVGERPPC